ncbi:MAG: PD-(D/E)XK nuclease family protein [Acidimicrobiales bacterium]
MASLLDSLASEILHSKGSDLLAPVTVIATSHWSAVALRRALGTVECPSTGTVGIANVNVTTADDLGRELASPRLSSEGLRVAPPPLRIEAIRLAARRSGHGLTALGSHDATVELLATAFDELDSCPEETIELIRRDEPRGREVVDLYRATVDIMAEHGFAGGRRVRLEAIQAARSGSGRLAGLGQVVVVEAGSTTGYQRMLLQELPPHCAVSRVALEWPHPQATSAASYPDPDEEVRSTLREVLRHAGEGIPLWKQAILHPPGSAYTRLVHQQLSAAGIPFNGAGGRSLASTMAGRLLAGVIKLADGDWPRDQVMAWIASVPVMDRDGSLIPASRWDRVSGLAGVLRSTDQWDQRLARLAEHGSLTDGGATAGEARRISGFVGELARFAAHIPTTWSDLARWSSEVLDRYLGIGPVASTLPQLVADNELAAAEQVRSLVSSLACLDGLSPAPDWPAMRRVVSRELASTAAKPAGNDTGGVGYGVFVAPFPYGRGMCLDAIHMIGMTESRVPGQMANDVVLPDALRVGIDSDALPSRAKRLETMLLDLRASLSSGSAVRRITWPRNDPRTGRAESPSRWMAELAGSRYAFSGPGAGTGITCVASFAAALSSGPPVSPAEYDLRSLHDWVARDHDPLASPLATTDTELAAGLDLLTARRRQRLTRFDGLVGASTVSPFDPSAAVSATRLERYAECPRRFLFERVLEVAAPPRPEDVWQIEPMDKGTLVHAILEDYVGERVLGAPASLDRLLEIAEGHFAEVHARGITGKPLLWDMDKAAIVRDLRRFFSEDLHQPLDAEVSFGDVETDAHSWPPVAVTLADGQEISFRGKVDRVDMTAEGVLLVSDYKTGRQSDLADLESDPVAAGTRLQLPLYAMAASRYYRSRGLDTSVTRARYWLVSSNRIAPSFVLDLSPEIEAWFSRAVSLVVQGIEAGLFPGIPGKTTNGSWEHCQRCDLDPLCPVERDMQWEQKSGDPAASTLAELSGSTAPDSLHGAVRRCPLHKQVDP